MGMCVPVCVCLFVFLCCQPAYSLLPASSFPSANHSYSLLHTHPHTHTAIIGYVATHIDEIKEKQAVATEATMKKQSSDIKSAQAQQKAAIEEAMRKQQEAINKIKK